MDTAVLSGGRSSARGASSPAAPNRLSAEDRDQRPITTLLRRWSEGDAEALDRLLPLVWRELRRQARRYMDRERPGHTLQATALIHETYLRLVELRRMSWRDREHFFAFAARTMRRVLVDHARARATAKRGDEARPEPLEVVEEVVLAGVTPDVDLLALDVALDRLAARDRDWARVVEMRFFAGLTLAETADVLGVGVATVSRQWAAARAWLYRELNPR